MFQGDFRFFCINSGKNEKKDFNQKRESSKNHQSFTIF